MAQLVRVGLPGNSSGRSFVTPKDVPMIPYVSYEAKYLDEVRDTNKARNDSFVLLATVLPAEIIDKVVGSFVQHMVPVGPEMLHSTYSSLHLRMQKSYRSKAASRMMENSTGKIVVRESSLLKEDTVWRPRRPYWFIMSCPKDLPPLPYSIFLND